MALELFRLRSPLAIQSFLDLRTWLYRLLNYMRGWTNVRMVSASQTLRIDDYIILIDEASATADITLTLPPLANCHTKQYIVRKLTNHATYRSFVQATTGETLYYLGANVQAEFVNTTDTGHYINAEQVWFILR